MSQSQSRVFKSEAIEHIAKIISQITGNQFAEKHNAMIEFRLKKRCLELKIDTIDNYYHFFKSHQNIEVNYLISLLTTHHTFFFREFSHFQFLEDRAISELIPIIRQRADKTIKIWSAACSKGHEVYSLAMFLEHTLKIMAPDLRYQILGTDIDRESLAFALNGVYTRKEIKEVPLAYLGNHWAKGTGDIADYVKVRSSLRDKTSWKEMNLMTLPDNFQNKFDLIFCRNVFIYFNQDQVKQSSIALLKHLEPHGYYFLGLSESLNGLGLPVVSQGPSIYRPVTLVDKEKSQIQSSVTIGTSINKQNSLNKENREISKISTPPLTGSFPSPNSSSSITPSFSSKEILRVLCVDDSPSILTLLKRILTKEDGFEVVGTASNGIEARLKQQELKPDLMTLDIHMPEQTGIEYLQKNFAANHPPVVMVSSVSREESDLAIKALHLGASDYIEKPALSNLREVADEIKRKLRCSYRNQVVYHQKTNLQLDDSFKKNTQIKDPQRFIRIIIAQLSDKKRIEGIIKELGPGQPPTFILLDGAKDALQGFSKSFKFTHQSLVEWPKQSLKANDIFIFDAKLFSGLINSSTKKTPSTILVLGEVSPNLKTVLQGWDTSQILIEDLGPKHNSQNPFRDVQTDIVPLTSFAYMSHEFLGRVK